MKTAIALLTLLTAPLMAQTFQDDFNDSQINSEAWSVFKNGSYDVIESNGYISFTNTLPVSDVGDSAGLFLIGGIEANDFHLSLDLKNTVASGEIEIALKLEPQGFDGMIIVGLNSYQSFAWQVYLDNDTWVGGETYIDSSAISIDLQFDAIDKLFAINVTADGNAVETGTFGIGTTEGSLGSVDLGLETGYRFTTDVYSFAYMIDEEFGLGEVTLDNFSLVVIPETNSTLIIGLVLFSTAIRRRYTSNKQRANVP